MTDDWAPLIWQATRETLVMVGIAMAVTIPLGLALGVLLGKVPFDRGGGDAPRELVEHIQGGELLRLVHALAVSSGEALRVDEALCDEQAQNDGERVVGCSRAAQALGRLGV